jgi:hypothetical protein
MVEYNWHVNVPTKARTREGKCPQRSESTAISGARRVTPKGLSVIEQSSGTFGTSIAPGADIVKASLFRRVCLATASPPHYIKRVGR